MSTEKKKYVSPKYEMIKFDSHIMTGWVSNCWGVVGNDFDMSTGTMTDSTCQYSYEPNIYPVMPEYWPDL